MKKIDDSLWLIEKRRVSDLIKNDRNPRIINKETLKGVRESLKRNGYIDKIVINNQNKILSGHARQIILNEQDPEMEIEVIVAQRDLTPEEEDNVLLGMNTQGGKWNMDDLGIKFDPLTLEAFDIEFNQIEPEKSVEEDEAPEVDDKNPPKTKLGDVWILENHRVMCGDSTSMEDFSKLMNGNLADLLITDPPYNVNYEGSSGLKIQNDSMSDSSFNQFLTDSFACANAFMRAGAVFYIWHADLEGYNFRDACKKAGWKIRENLIWVKNALVMGRQDYQWKHEPCLYGWKDGAAHTWNSDRSQTTVLEFNKPKHNDVHPTMKPVELFSYQITNSSSQNEIVIDSFGGSGTAIVCCEQLNRKCYTMELDPKYVDVIVKRWQNLTGKTAHLESDNTPFGE